MALPSSNNINLLIVTVNYFSASLVAQLLEQLETQSLPENIRLKVVCFDNSASPDEVAALASIKAKSPIDFNVAQSPSNIGFGAAINSSAQGQQFDYLCCINPDVSLLNETLASLITHAVAHPDQGIWGGITLDEHQQVDFRHAWQEATLKNTLAWALGLNHLIRNESWHSNYQHKSADGIEAYPVDAVSGCCFLISAAAWQAVQGFDPDFFLYSEEIDLCLRSRQAGFQPTVVPRAKLHHASHSSDESFRRLNTLFNSKLLYASKHHGLLYNICYRLLILLGSVVRSFKALVRGRRNAAQAWAGLATNTIAYRAHDRLQRPSKSV